MSLPQQQGLYANCKAIETAWIELKTTNNLNK